MTPTYEIRAKLDELGIAWVAISETATEYTQEGILYRAYETRGGLQVAILTPVTPEQAIAATVGRRTDLAKRLREVTGLRAFAELFGFKWIGGDDWTWHDVACAMADAVDAQTAGTGTCEDDGSIEQAYVPERTATRKVTSFGEVGRCNCSACNWCIDPFDLHCRRCGARFTETIYERGSR